MEAMRFETIMKMFFRDKAHQIAGTVNNPKERKKWLLQTVDHVVKIIDNLDAPIKHKERLISTLEHLKEEIQKTEAPNWQMIDEFLVLVAQLLGYRFDARIYSISYWQDEDQYYTEQIQDGKEREYYYHTKNIVGFRRKIVQQLKSEGHNNHTIALILNISEYKVKQLLNS